MPGSWPEMGWKRNGVIFKGRRLGWLPSFGLWRQQMASRRRRRLWIMAHSCLMFWPTFLSFFNTLAFTTVPALALQYRSHGPRSFPQQHNGCIWARLEQIPSNRMPKHDLLAPSAGSCMYRHAHVLLIEWKHATGCCAGLRTADERDVPTTCRTTTALRCDPVSGFCQPIAVRPTEQRFVNISLVLRYTTPMYVHVQAVTTITLSSLPRTLLSIYSSAAS